MQLNDERPEAENTNDETQSADIAAGVAEISADLFGQEEDKGKSETEAGGETDGTETVASPPAPEPETEGGTEQQPVVTGEGDNSAAVQAAGAPKTWTKDALETWAQIPDRAKQEILKREADMFNGISQYKAAAEVGVAYDQVVEPYRAVLAAEGVNPVELFASFAGNHYLLSRGTPEQKVQLAANLLQAYNIDFNSLAEQIGSQILNPVDPEIAALRREIQDLRGGFNQQQSAVLDQRRQGLATEVDAFASDPAHPYFEEVADDMSRFISGGSATSLQDAYEKAVWANPATRQKEIDRVKAEEAAALKAAEKERQDKRRKSQGDHVTTMPTDRAGTSAKGSMDDTLAETMRDISSRTD